jgi:hypothetical protein
MAGNVARILLPLAFSWRLQPQTCVPIYIVPQRTTKYNTFFKKICKKNKPQQGLVVIYFYLSVENPGLPLFTLTREGEEENWYSAAFIE